MHERRLVVGEVLMTALTSFKQNWQLLLSAGGLVHLVMLGYLLAGAAILGLLGVTSRAFPLIAVPVMILFAVGGMALSTLLHMGFKGICLAVHRGQTPAVSSLFAHRRALGRGLAASFLFGLATAAAIGLTELLPFAGDIVVALVAGLSAVCVSFAYFFIIDRDRAALNAIEASLRTVRQGGLPVAGLFVCCLGITGIASLIPLVGPMIGWSISSLAYSEAYDRLSR